MIHRASYKDDGFDDSNGERAAEVVFLLDSQKNIDQVLQDFQALLII
jgi:hypothetical protein